VRNMRIMRVAYIGYHNVSERSDAGLSPDEELFNGCCYCCLQIFTCLDHLTIFVGFLDFTADLTGFSALHVQCSYFCYIYRHRLEPESTYMV